MRLLLLLLPCFILACSSGNSIVIDRENGDSASLRLTDNGLHINPALLGLPKGSDITIHTSPESEMTFNVDLPGESQGAAHEERAF